MPKVIERAILTLAGISFWVLGDSMMKRLFYQCMYPFRTRSFDDCTFAISGLSIRGLSEKIEKAKPEDRPTGNVILMIGTNDLHHSRRETDYKAPLPGQKKQVLSLNFSFFAADYLHLVWVLNNLCNIGHIIILSLPPIPKAKYCSGFIPFWKQCNDLIEHSMVPLIRNSEFLSIRDIFWNRHISQPIYANFVEYNNKPWLYYFGWIETQEQEDWWVRMNHVNTLDLLHWNCFGIDKVELRLLELVTGKQFTYYKREKVVCKRVFTKKRAVIEELF
jgi:hypothetical protein